MMDRDYPMSPRQARVLAVGLVAMAAVGAALFGGWIPGLRPNFNPPATVAYDGREYYYASEPVPWPPLGSNQSAVFVYLLHNVTFRVWAANWYRITGGNLEGNVTVPNGTTYPFLLGRSPVNASYATEFATPGAEVVIFWSGGLSYEPLVRVPSGS